MATKLAKTAWILPEKYSHTSISAYKRLTWHVAQNLQIVVLDRPAQYHRHWNTYFRNCVIVYAAQYAPFDTIADFLDRHKECKLFWLTNEYALSPNGSVYKLFKERGYQVIANYVPSAFGLDKRYVLGFHVVNLNALLVDPDVPKPEKKLGIVYYGGFRPDRARYFNRYFNGLVEFYLSTSKKNVEKFLEIGAKAKFIAPLKWSGSRSSLGYFKFSLYVEDVYTHTHYNHPANRFYECLSNWVVQLFDRSCQNTFAEAGYEIPEMYWVSSAEELAEKMKVVEQDFDKHVEEQRALWLGKAVDEKQAVLAKLSAIFEGV